MARNYNNGRLVTVTIAGFPNLQYGFKTRAKTTTSTELGHTAIDPVGIASITGIVLGANAPKPPRASKRTETGIESSFVDKGKIAEARNNGYQVARGRVRRGGKTKFAQVKYVTINGINYAWAQPNIATPPPGLDQADLKDPDENTKLVFGAKFPKPPRMKIEIAGGEGESGGVFSTFVDPTKVDNLVKAGWSPADDGAYKTEDFKQLA